MKCELCHKHDAETAMVRTNKDGQEEELYVCPQCAKAERIRRQKRSQRTRKIAGLPPGVSMSVTEISSGDGTETPPFVSELMNAVEGAITDIQHTLSEYTQKPAKAAFKTFPLDRVEPDLLLAGGLHLEGLFTIGEIEPVERACRALDCQLFSDTFDGVKSPGHVYCFRYACSDKRARRVLADILRQERNARRRMLTARPRYFLDSLCRALALLKNCRFLSPAELVDLLSPLRLAAREDMLDGITSAQIKALLEKAVRRMKARVEDEDTSDEARDREDAARADAINARFEDVVINEHGELNV